MKLYVCWGTWRRPTPVIAGGPHPCGVAHEEAGYEPEVKRAYGWVPLPEVLNQTLGRRKVKELTGELTVPVSVTDDDQVAAGSEEIKAWAEANPVG